MYPTSTRSSARTTGVMQQVTRFLAAQSGAGAGRRMLSDGFGALAPTGTPSAPAGNLPPPAAPVAPPLSASPPPAAAPPALPPPAPVLLPPPPAPITSLNLSIPPLSVWQPGPPPQPVQALPPGPPPAALPAVPTPGAGQATPPAGTFGAPTLAPSGVNPFIAGNTTALGFDGQVADGLGLNGQDTCAPVLGKPGSQISLASLQDPKAQPALWNATGYKYVNTLTIGSGFAAFDPAPGFSLTDIAQRDLGICWLWAATYALLERGFEPPHCVVGFDDYEFTFCSGLEPVTVRVDSSLPTLKDFYDKTGLFVLVENAGAMHEDGRVAIWANMMAKAYAKFTDAAPAFKAQSGSGYNGLAGGLSQRGFQALTCRVSCTTTTGNNLVDPAGYTPAFDQKMALHIADLIRPSWANSKTPICLGTVGKDMFETRGDAGGCFATLGNKYCLLTNTPDGQEGIVRITRDKFTTYFVIDHEYPLVGFNEVIVQGQSQSALVAMHNPWGEGLSATAADPNKYQDDPSHQGDTWYALSDISPLIDTMTIGQMP